MAPKARLYAAAFDTAFILPYWAPRCGDVQRTSSFCSSRWQRRHHSVSTRQRRGSAGGQSGAAPDRTIQHAGLIYGYWAEEPPSERERRRKHRGCYFINLRGEASAVRRRFDAVLEEIVADFQARGADEGLGYISDDDDDDDDEEEDDDGSE